MKLIWVEFFIWGYTRGIQVWFGGAQRGTILICRYASTKSLRNPGLGYYSIKITGYCYHVLHAVSLSPSQNNHLNWELLFLLLLLLSCITCCQFISVPKQSLKLGTSVFVIIVAIMCFMLSVCLRAKVITLSGFHCSNQLPNWRNFEELP
jgi:hypothetical protein